MTVEQASMELARLCKELGRRPDTLSPEQTRAWLRVLEGMRYERGRAAVTHLVNTWARDTFPPPGSLTRAASEISFEGKPGAAAYMQDSENTPWHQTPDSFFAMWRQDQIESMTFPVPIPGEPDGGDPDSVIERQEGRYWAYAYNTNGYRLKCEDAWRRMWARGETA